MQKAQDTGCGQIDPAAQWPDWASHTVCRPPNIATTLPRVVNLVLNWPYLAEDMIRGKNCYVQSES